MNSTTAVEFAAYFVASQKGGAERILRRHHPTPNGSCAGCLATPTCYPCQAARIAETAQQMHVLVGAQRRADPRRPVVRPRS